MSRKSPKAEKKIYRIELVDTSSHKTVWSQKGTKTSMTVVLTAIVILFTAAIYALIAYTPIRITIPGYPDAKTRRMAITNAIKIDSLESVITRWELYSENLSRVVAGETPVSIDSILRITAYSPDREADPKAMASRDSMLRSQVTRSEQFDLSQKDRDLPIEDLHFFPPLKGVISQPYNRVLHPYVDVTAPAGSVVMSVLDGTVIFAGWNDEFGYTIQIQHDGDIVTVYKHNQKLLKKTGDRVSAGAPIALLGNTGSLTTGDHLHFEMWYKGEAIDPTQYINF
ncbi:MAG: M23 family metallopeptidase [Bacteroidales bacterium]|nr:M23 family metallopeptidase [Bacteroidales bacterium]